MHGYNYWAFDKAVRSGEQKDVILNAMNLYDSRNKIIKLFEEGNIKSSNYAYNAKSEQGRYDGIEKSEQKFDESVRKRVKLRRQKSDEMNKMFTDKADNKADKKFKN